jgi:hypothetical protein
MHEGLHLSNEELLLAADGELNAARAARVRAHLSACWQCRTRMRDIEAAIAEFTSAYRLSEDSLPPADGPRALLRARLAEAGNLPQLWPWLGLRASIAALAIVVIALAGLISLELRHRPDNRADFESRATPRMSLTPGAIRIVTRSEVCEAGPSERPRVVPASVRRQVFEEYGMTLAKADAFEVDYLVTPELGGAEDIRNLWPEPYSATIWNARVKDALEERLHEMVCSGQIDLATAQHDLATDWISAYKKYFHTDKPF